MKEPFTVPCRCIATGRRGWVVMASMDEPYMVGVKMDDTGEVEVFDAADVKPEPLGENR